MVDATGVDEDDVVYVLRYFHGGNFVSSPKFDYVDWKVDKLQVDPDRLCYWDIIRNVSAFVYLKKLKFVYYRIPAVTFNTVALVLVHDDDTEVDTLNGGNVVVRSNVTGSSYDHVVGPEGEDLGPKLAENEPHIGDNDSSDDNGSEHVEVGPEITNIWADHVDVGADHVDVGPVSENGSQNAENGPVSENGLELADNETTDDNGAEGGVDGSEEDAFLFNIDIGSDVDEEIEEIRGKGRDKRHKEKAADREQAADREGQPVQPDNVDEGNRSSDKDGKLEGYETDYISSSDPGEYEDSEQSDDDVPRVRQYLLPRYDPNCVIPVWELGLRFDDNE
ncbi:hypothetical protein V6N12_050159 [Hibiscus sabdariffa]|uniref:PB1-like domain-containing protein n=1 Tax=Hibiscus sabdariffa TaxID=183260 RepID=A0ABR2GBQ7_9ROSI